MTCKPIFIHLFSLFFHHQNSMIRPLINSSSYSPKNAPFHCKMRQYPANFDSYLHCDVTVTAYRVRTGLADAENNPIPTRTCAC